MSRRVSSHPLPDPHPRTITAVLGPTNTGKTHYALDRMVAHESGMIGLPLRLLAREIYDKIVAQCGSASVALITGEEKIIPRNPRYYVSTVEAMPLDIEVAFLAVDEIQLCEDPERGHVFTDRLLHARGTEETMFLGAETIRPLLAKLIPGTRFVSRARYSDLSYAGPRKLSRLPRRSAIVSFSSESVYAMAELIRRQRGGAAVVMGALSPRTRNAQVELYQSGDVDYLVATDAIGMGLNMDIDHVAFASLSKFDGTHMRSLRASETAQIAGRAGRYMNNGTFGTTADSPKMTEEMIEQIESHRFDPVRCAYWRNRALDFSSLRQLIRSLEIPAPKNGLTRTRAVTDLLALKGLAQDDEIRRVAASKAGLLCLWEICQVPDFRQVMLDEHINLLKSIFDYLSRPPHQIPEDWMATKLAQLDRTDGDIDTLSNRISHIRTWTYVSNRSRWLKDSLHWCERARDLEDKLSDALHDRLTQRFVDRRTSVLIKNLRERTDLMARVSDQGEVSVEGEYVGRLMGFRFHADPRARGIHGKALRNAASRALQPELRRRAHQLACAADDAIQLKDTGKLWWEDAPVATLHPGKDWLHPRLEGLFGELTDASLTTRVQDRLQSWLTAHLEDKLAPLYRAKRLADGKPEAGKRAHVSPAVRGLCFQLFENFALLDRPRVKEEILSLGREDRKRLRKLGVRIGYNALYFPSLLKPQSADVCFTLVRVWHGQSVLNLPGFTNRGVCRIEADPSINTAYYRALGFVVFGSQALRADIFDRLCHLIETESRTQTKARRDEAVNGAINEEDMAVAAILGEASAPGDNGKRSRAPAGFQITPEMLSLTGCSAQVFEQILLALGYRTIAYRGNQQADGEFDLFQDEPAVTLWAREKRRLSPKRRSGTKRPDKAPSRPDPRLPADTVGHGEVLELDVLRGGARPSAGAANGHSKRSRPNGPRPKRQTGNGRNDSPFAVLATLQGAK